MGDNELGFADQELNELRRRGFGFHYYGNDRNALTALAAIYRWHEVVDVAIIRGGGYAETVTYRVPVIFDIFDPPAVVAYYIGNAAWALRWLMTLDPPIPLSSSCSLVKMPTGQGIPQDSRRPVTVRPPKHGGSKIGLMAGLRGPNMGGAEI